MCSLVFTIEVAGRGIQISVLASHIHERKGMTDEGPLEQTKSKLSHCLWQVFTHKEYKNTNNTSDEQSSSTE